MTGPCRARVAGLAALLIWLLVVGPAQAASGQAASGPPDRVDPPAPGEGTPLPDPTEPAPAAYAAMAQPTVDLRLNQRRWRRPSMEYLGAGAADAAAARISRKGWKRGAGAAVVVQVASHADVLSASTLAGAGGGPVLLTRPDRLSRHTARELRRLRSAATPLRRVYVVGRLTRGRAAAAIGRIARVERLGSGDRYRTSFAVATRAVELGADARRVIVTSGVRLDHGKGVAALAAGTTHPVLLTRPGHRSTLRRRVQRLGASTTDVVGPASRVPGPLVRGLPSVRRLAGSDPAGTAAAVARRARRLGLDGRPVLVGRASGTAALTAGVFAGSRRGGTLLVTKRRELSHRTAVWLDRDAPAVLSVFGDRGDVGRMPRCQAARGRYRPWYCIERELRRQGYVMGRVDGHRDRFSIWAVYAFEKVAGRRANGRFGEAEWNRLLDAPRRPVRRPRLGRTHIEIDIARQLILLVEDGRVAHHIHTSTGKASTPTIRGNFTVYEKRSYRQANGIYKGIFFHRGYAIHGYPSIPTYPASHGCSRTYDGNQDFLWPKVFVGERVGTY